MNVCSVLVPDSVQRQDVLILSLMSFFGLYQTEFLQKAVLEANYFVYFDFCIAYFSRLMYTIALMCNYK
jgi:hypothetical protein